jgi:hypothetical protein
MGPNRKYGERQDFELIKEEQSTWFREIKSGVIYNTLRSAVLSGVWCMQWRRKTMKIGNRIFNDDPQREWMSQTNENIQSS